MDLTAVKSFFRRIIGLFLPVLMVAFVAIVGLVPQQALADSSLAAGSIAGFASSNSSDDEEDSFFLQPQGFSDGVFTSTNAYLLNNMSFRPSDNFDPADYSDGKIAVRLICDPSVGYQVEIVGVVDGTWLKVPESIPARVVALDLYFDAWMMWEKYQQGDYSDESIAFMDYVLEDDWRNMGGPGNAPGLKESIYSSNDTALVVKVSSASPYSFDGVETLSFEETPDSANLQELYISEAFIGCDSLTSVTFPSYRKYVLDRAFVYCDSLTSVKLTSSLNTNPSKGSSKYCFWNCTNLETADLSEVQGIVPRTAFYDSPKLRNVQLGSGITSIGEYAFYKCTSLESIVLPDSVSAIDSHAFDCCTALNDVQLGSGVTSIGDYSFRSCTSLESIVFPNSVSSIGHNAFTVCTALKNVTWPINPNFTKVDGFSYCMSLGKEAIETLPESVVSIGSEPTPLDLLKTSDEAIFAGAFSGCRFYEDLTIPDSVKTIGSYAFYQCVTLDGKTITIPSGVDTIGHKAFAISTYPPISLTLKFENPDFSFTPIGDASVGNVNRILDSNSETATAFYNPFGDTYVTFDASETSQNGETSLLKQAYDSYYVYEEDYYSPGQSASSGSTIEPMSTRVFPSNESKKEYQFKTPPVVIPNHLITGTVPWSAFVSLMQSGEMIYVPTFIEGDGVNDYGIFEFDASEGSDVQIRVSLGGARVLTFEKDAASFTEDWDVCNVVIFDTGEGTAFEEQVVETGSVAVLPDSTLEREGYRFDYWYAGADDSVAYDFTTAVTAPLILHAKWVKQWTVAASSADALKGYVKIGARDAAASDSLAVDDGAGVSVTAVPAEGYHFSSWSLDGTPLLGSQATFTQSNVSADLSLVANFERDTVAITFDTGGGTTVPSAVIEKGSEVARPSSDPIRSGYRFAYWYEDSAPMAAYNFAAPVNESITLHAKWVKQWTVAASSADAQKGFVKIGARDAAATDSLAVDEGDSVSVIAVPAEGYHFSSWSLDGTPLIGSQATFTQSIVTSDLVLVAYFEKDEDPVDPEDPSGEDNPSGGDEPAATATITVVGVDGGALVGGTVTGAGVHEIGSLVTLTAAPDQGYEFRGWKSEGDIELIPANDVLNETAARILQVMATGDDEYLSTDSSIRFRVTGDATIQAIFEGVQSDSEPEDDPQPGTDPEPVVDPQPGVDDPEPSVDPQPGIDDPEPGDDPQPSTDDPEQGDNPSQGEDPSKGDGSEKTSQPEQGKDSEKESSVDATGSTTKATSTVTTKADAAKGFSTPATGDTALMLAINALSILVLVAFLAIAFRRRA